MRHNAINLQAVNSQLDFWVSWHAACLMMAILVASYLGSIAVLQIVGFISMLICASIWLRAQRQFYYFGLANSITLMRFCLLFAAPLWLTMERGSFAAVILLFLLLDGVDGGVARARQEESIFGARFDMEIDALAILFLCLGLHVYHGIALWILWPGLIRYIFVLFRAWYSVETVAERRSQWGRVIYIVLASSIALGFVFDHGLIEMLLWMATFLVTLSFWQDLKELLQHRLSVGVFRHRAAKV